MELTLGQPISKAFSVLYFLVKYVVSFDLLKAILEPKSRDYVREGGVDFSPLEFGGLEKKTERETDNLLLMPPNHNPNCSL